MKKYLLLTLLIIAVAGIIYFIFYDGTSTDKMTISVNNEKIKINNILKNPVTTFKGGVSFKKNSDYTIQYYEPDQSFTIGLNNPNIRKARQEAEQEFLNTLGVTREQACKLKVNLSVPFDIKPEVSGRNYGLSFCPNGSPF